ncbi:hypothetical protein TRICI_002679 [Trichomonascus ciferrii]|uniref:pyridoxal 5'-phosphate synthase n=1 Tax=Trichomonascus ciferrii TaxID=44093 RepID=A0A642V792_9ASCO|nr:hypothetical protein TRICI_002679 [Trichomonascus ciferrii]
MTQAVANDKPVKENDLIFAPETEQYTKFHLDRKDLNVSPGNQFHQWFQEAKANKVALPESTIFSTARLPSGRVSSRTVLLKELDKEGNLVIYSNWGTSKKAKDIESNQYASLTFFWKELERQVRIEGITEFLTNEESQIYFDTRPRASRIGAWASPQSTPLQNRQELEDKVKEVENRFEGVDKIPCPPFWGGLKIKPLEWEFFQGRTNRTHDRFSYTRESVDDNSWTIQRLSS